MPQGKNLRAKGKVARLKVSTAGRILINSPLLARQSTGFLSGRRLKVFALRKPDIAMELFLNS